MACECLKSIDDRLTECRTNTKLSRSFWLGDSVGMTVSIGTQLVEKKRGAKPVAMKPTYCPFCGVKYEQQATP